MIRPIAVSLLVALAIGWSAYVGLLPVLAILLLPGLLLGLLIGESQDGIERGVLLNDRRGPRLPLTISPIPRKNSECAMEDF